MKNWKVDQDALHRQWKFSDYLESIDFIHKVALEAEHQSHHPKIIIDYLTVDIYLTTHDQGSTISEKDYKLANSINKIYEQL